MKKKKKDIRLEYRVLGRSDYCQKIKIFRRKNKNSNHVELKEMGIIAPITNHYPKMDR